MMEAQCAAIVAAIDRLGAIQVELVSLSTRSDDRRRHDLIVQRRALAAQTAHVGELAEALFDEMNDLAMTYDYRRLFSVLRSKAAIHQTNWSAVRVGESQAEYIISAREAGKAYHDLIKWLRVTVADITKR